MAKDRWTQCHNLCMVCFQFQLAILYIEKNFESLRGVASSLLASSSLGIIEASSLNILLYFIWLMITDEGSIPEMHIWSILLF